MHQGAPTVPEKTLDCNEENTLQQCKGTLQCTKEHPPSLYALNYVFDHLAGASSNCSFLEGVAHADMGGTHHAAISHIEVSEMLDAALQRWEFLHHVFQGVAIWSSPMSVASGTSHLAIAILLFPLVGIMGVASAANMVRALGNIPRHERSMYTDDSFLWARRLYHDLMARPANMEKTTETAPISPSYILLSQVHISGAVPFCVSVNNSRLAHQDSKGHTDWLYSLAYSPDGRQLASSSKDGTIWLWDLANGQIRAKLEGHNGTVLSVTFNPNGRQLASSGDDRSVHLWDLASGMCTAVLRNHTSWVYRVAYSPDGMQLASAGARDGMQAGEAPGCDRTIKLWDVASESCTRTLEGHSDFVYGICYSPGGNVIASASKDESIHNEIKIWLIETQECVATLQGHTHHVIWLDFRSDGKQLASSSSDNTVRLWDMEAVMKYVERRKPALPNIKLDTNASETNSDRGSNKQGSGSDTTTSYNNSNKNNEKSNANANSDANNIPHAYNNANNANANNDANNIANANNNANNANGNADGNSAYHSFHSSAMTLRGHTDFVHSISYSPDGMRLASGSKDKAVMVWDTETGESLATLQGHSGWVYSVVYSPDGKLIASSSADGTLRLWAQSDSI
eukprot:gene18001-24409_t